MSNQDDVFLQSEGDHWFNRNADVIHSKEKLDKDIPLKMLKMYPDLKPKHVLEIGCANGYRLEQIRKDYSAKCVGVEPSISAIEDGKKLYPELKLLKGVASELPIQSQKFDLVMICFVLHWVSRDTLFKSIAEIDRMVEEDGFLLVGDFFPDTPARRKYHHRTDHEMYTYKQDYAKLFLESGLYQIVSRVTFDQDTATLMANTESGRRGVHTLMRKVKNGIYSES